MVHKNLACLIQAFVAAHLAIVLAAKVGLYKIVLGIALVVAAMKAMVVMAWALSIFKYVPDLYRYKDHKSHLPIHDTAQKLILDYFSFQGK